MTPTSKQAIEGWTRIFLLFAVLLLISVISAFLVKDNHSILPEGLSKTGEIAVAHVLQQ